MEKCIEDGCHQEVTWIDNPNRNKKDLGTFYNEGLTSTIAYPIVRGKRCYWHDKMKRLGKLGKIKKGE